MARNRVISASEALFVGPSPATGDQTTGVLQLHRVQTVAQNFTVNRQNVSQFGQLAVLSREINEAPTVGLDFSYFLTNVLNEQRLGFVVDGSVSAITNLLNKTQDEKNYYLLQASEGVDAIGDTANDPVIAIGNGFMSSYSTEAAVNGFPTSTVRVEALNIASYSAQSGQQSPAVNPVDGSKVSQSFNVPGAVSGVAGQVPVLKHGDITLNLVNPAVGVDINDIKVQRYTLAFNLARTSLQKLGSKFAFSKELNFPIAVTLNVDAEVGDMTTGNLADILCNDQSFDLSIALRKPQCTGFGPVAVNFDLRNAKLNSQNFNSTIGPSKTVAMVWESTIGGPDDQMNGVFISGQLT